MSDGKNKPGKMNNNQTLPPLTAIFRVLGFHRYNVGENCDGAGIRLGGWEVDGETYGQHCDVSPGVAAILFQLEAVAAAAAVVAVAAAALLLLLLLVVGGGGGGDLWCWCLGWAGGMKGKSLFGRFGPEPPDRASEYTLYSVALKFLGLLCLIMFSLFAPTRDCLRRCTNKTLSSTSE